jgi:hypothetical protein
VHSVGRQDAIEMLACRDAELDEPLVTVVLDCSAAGEQLVGDLLVGRLRRRFPGPPCRRERAGDTAGGARSSRCGRVELAATAERALALGWLNHCSILPPAADGRLSVWYRAERRSFGCPLSRDLVRNWTTLPAVLYVFAGVLLIPLPGFELDQAGSLRHGRGLSADLEQRSRPPQQGHIADRLGRRDQQQPLRFLRQRPHPL